MNTALKVRIIGQASCPFAGQKGYDGDSARCNLLSNGKILCVSCGTLHEGSSEQRKRASRELVERVYSIVGKACGQGPQILRGTRLANDPNLHKVPEFDPQNPDKLLISPYAGSCLSGYDPNTFEQVNASFTGDVLSANLHWFPDELEQALTPDLDYDEPLGADEVPLVPAVAVELINNLQTEFGFRVRGNKATRNEYLASRPYHLGLSCGKSIGSMGYVSGLSLALSWKVSVRC